MTKMYINSNFKTQVINYTTQCINNLACIFKILNIDYIFKRNSM